ncbi:MAG: hypothetical protein Ct9H90mP19_3680 [Gammaproteobacteria bacterium]|nr:MAG: hypothetical protein Ct9H90mP19_3680 [Gammaproteobacteria bacterium]
MNYNEKNGGCIILGNFLSQIDRFLHVLFGITWIGLLYYFNFVGAGYLKEATPEGKKDVLQKLQPNALWYFRWAAFFTFLTGVYLLWYIGTGYSVGMSLGALMATIMFLNVWLIIWPNQKKVIAGLMMQLSWSKSSFSIKNESLSPFQCFIS